MRLKYTGRCLAMIFILLLCARLPAIAEEDSNNVEFLENGLGVMIIPDARFPLVSLRLYVHAGSGYETRKTPTTPTNTKTPPPTQKPTKTPAKIYSMEPYMTITAYRKTRISYDF